MRANTVPSFNRQTNRWSDVDKRSNQSYPSSTRIGRVDSLGNCAYWHGRNYRESEYQRRACINSRRLGHAISECRLKQRREGQISKTNSIQNAALTQRAFASQAWSNFVKESDRTKGNKIRVYIDNAASIDMIDGDSELGSYITSTTDSNVREKG